MGLRTARQPDPRGSPAAKYPPSTRDPRGLQLGGVRPPGDPATWGPPRLRAQGADIAQLSVSRTWAVLVSSIPRAGGVCPDTSRQLLSQMLSPAARCRLRAPQRCWLCVTAPAHAQRDALVQFPQLSCPLSPSMTAVHVAPILRPAVAAGMATWRQSEWAKGFIYVQSQYIMYSLSQHGSGLQAPCFHHPFAVQGGTHISLDPASRGRPMVHGSVLGLLRWEQSLQQREQIC